MAKSFADDLTAPKSGFLTSEFWATAATVVANFIAFLVVLGKIAPDDAQTLNNAIAGIITGLPVVIANVLVVLSFIRGRTQQKETFAETKRLQFRMKREQMKLQRLQLQQAPPAAPAVSKTHDK